MNELIEKYFENNLTSKEQKELEDKLENDAEFRSEFEFYTELKKAVMVSERQKIKNQIQAFETAKKESSAKFTIRKLLPYAALFAIVFSLVLYFSSNQNSNASLYASHFEPYPNVEISNLRNDSNSSSEKEAFTAYDLGDYKLAQELFGKIIETEPKDYLYFYNGICLMELNKYDLALTQFNAITDANSKYYEKGIWFKALANLKLNKVTTTKELLNELVTNYSFKKTEATTLLSKL
ncbi:hypothetical protein GOQ30_09940 [Flavobacterium sp. TP390]|uniref:Tetratricopeptide repeat protein n=1 Tax=Flavobacterium profundi TaxID=1774945 RepID=A0A6I4ISQ3_9FLAO|nr:hypothetical protein [Flavobacterium profundi]MVO09477.1 hypothetical protein [Flavobacterium profundi]